MGRSPFNPVDAPSKWFWEHYLFIGMWRIWHACSVGHLSGLSGLTAGEDRGWSLGCSLGLIRAKWLASHHPCLHFLTSVLPQPALVVTSGVWGGRVRQMKSTKGILSNQTDVDVKPYESTVKQEQTITLQTSLSRHAVVMMLGADIRIHVHPLWHLEKTEDPNWKLLKKDDFHLKDCLWAEVVWVSVGHVSGGAPLSDLLKPIAQ